MKPRTKSALKLLGLCLAVAPALVADSTTAAFTAATSNTTNSFTADPDWVGPPIPSSIIQKTELMTGGFLRSDGQYCIYANVGPDSGNPAAGIASVTANVAVAGNVITAGQTAVALATTGGPWTVNGVSYAYRNAANLTAGTLTNANRTYSITATDADTPTGNVVSANFSVTGDITRPNDTGIGSANGGSIVGRMETGDSIIYTFSEQIETESILAGWNGTSTSVVVRITNGTGATNDQVQIWNSSNATQLPLGQVRTGSNAYLTAVVAPATYGHFGMTGTPSTMVMTSPTVLTVTFGTSSGTYATVGNVKLSWRSSDAPSAIAIIDPAGNTVNVGSVTESGGNDPNF